MAELLRLVEKFTIVTTRPFPCFRELFFTENARGVSIDKLIQGNISPLLPMMNEVLTSGQHGG